MSVSRHGSTGDTLRARLEALRELLGDRSKPPALPAPAADAKPPARHWSDHDHDGEETDT